MELIRLLLRNTLRHKLRSLLTIVGIAVAVMAFVLLRTVVTAWHAGVEASTANRLVTRHALSVGFSSAVVLPRPDRSGAGSR